MTIEICFRFDGHDLMTGLDYVSYYRAEHKFDTVQGVETIVGRVDASLTIYSVLRLHKNHPDTHIWLSARIGGLHVEYDKSYPKFDEAKEALEHMMRKLSTIVGQEVTLRIDLLS